MRKSTYLRSGDDPIEKAVRYDTKKDAVAAFECDAKELDRYGQVHEASLHYANNKKELVEYPDFTLSLGPRGGVRVEKA